MGMNERRGIYRWRGALGVWGCSKHPMSIVALLLTGGMMKHPRSIFLPPCDKCPRWLFQVEPVTTAMGCG